MIGMPVEPRVTEYLYRKATAAGVPLSGTFELTPVCNMDCKMCYVRLSRQEQERRGSLLDADQWLQLGQQAKDAGMLYLLLTGGEPFLHPQIQKIIEGLHQMGLLISINTNGTLLDEKTIAWLQNCPPVRLNLSIYGASNETYHRLCGNPEGFTQLTNAVDSLQKAGLDVKLNCSLTPDNQDDLAAMVAFAQDRQLPIQVATYMFPPVRKDGKLVGENHRFTPEDAAYYMAYADYLTLGKERFLASLDQLPQPADPEDPCGDLGDGIRCRAGKCSFWVTWQGRIMPCGMFPESHSCSLLEQPFAAAWDWVKADTATIRLPAGCAGCAAKDLCHACAAMVLTESGCFETVPAYRCQMMHAYNFQRNRVKEELL